MATKRKPRKTTNVIVVPKPPASAYNPDRPLDPNSLLLHQIRQFQHAEQQWAEHERTGHDGTKVETEGQAAEYLRKMTHAMHERGRPKTHQAGAHEAGADQAGADQPPNEQPK